MNESTSVVRQRNADCPATTVLECFAVGDEKGSALADHVRGCIACKQFVEAVQQEHDTFVRQQPAEHFLRRLDEKKKRSAWLAFRMPLFSFAGLTAAAAMALLLFNPAQIVHWKGGHFGAVYKREGMTQPKQVIADLRLRKGDALRFSFEAPKDGYLLILEVDANKKVSSFYPLHGTRSEAISSGPRRFLPGSVILDDAPGPEWLVAVFSPKPLDVDSLVESLRASSALDEPKPGCDCQVENLRVQKEP